MAADRDPHSAKFPLMSSVRIKSSGQLEAFSRNGTLRYPPSGKQIEYGGQADSIRRITFSIRGDVLYELEKAPGMWHGRKAALDVADHGSEGRVAGRGTSALDEHLFDLGREGAMSRGRCI